MELAPEDEARGSPAAGDAIAPGTPSLRHASRLPRMLAGKAHEAGSRQKEKEETKRERGGVVGPLARKAHELDPDKKRKREERS